MFVALESYEERVYAGNKEKYKPTTRGKADMVYFTDNNNASIVDMQREKGNLHVETNRRTDEKEMRCVCMQLIKRRRTSTLILEGVVEMAILPLPVV